MTNMIRPFWTQENKDYWRDYWKQMDVTVLVCQRKTLDITRLCMESLLRWYPDIPVLIVDGDSQDESTLYCQMLAAKYENVTCWIRPNDLGGRNSSHGMTMHDAIRDHIKTKYVLLMDSDTITERGGWIEAMISTMRMKAKISDSVNEQINDVIEKHPMAIGTIMEVSYDEEACGAPKDDSDKMRYAHPSCSLYDVQMYLDSDEAFCNHGAPCYRTMRYCRDHDIPVLDFPVERYVSHLSGHSWVDVPTVWEDDHDVIGRPFFSTFHDIGYGGIDIQQCFIEGKSPGLVRFWSESEPTQTKSYNGFAERNYVLGEYVIVPEPMINISYSIQIHHEHIMVVKQLLISRGMPTEYEAHGYKYIRRQHWQRYYAIK